jgi:hypothetical protein
MAIPLRDSLLLTWSTNTDARLTASPTAYGTTAAVATQYAALHDAFVLAYNNLLAGRAAGIRSGPLTAIKDDAKTALLDFARPLYKTIQANTAVPDSGKIELGIVVPKTTNTPRPVPAFCPGLTVASVDGRVAKVRLWDPANPTHSRMPDGCDGAIVMSHVGPTAPADPSLYKMEGPTSRMTVDVVFPEGLAAGTQVWLTAVFFNERKQMGPACNPVGTQINFGGSMPMAS